MADTIEFSAVDSAWVEVSASSLTGFMTNQGSSRVRYREDAVDPTAAEVDGHELMSKQSINFSLVTGQKVWVRSVRGTNKIVVTPGV